MKLLHYLLHDYSSTVESQNGMKHLCTATTKEKKLKNKDSYKRKIKLTPPRYRRFLLA